VVLGLRAARYVGIDSSAEMVRTARATCVDARAKFLHASIEDLALSPASCDLVLSEWRCTTSRSSDRHWPWPVASCALEADSYSPW